MISIESGTRHGDGNGYTITLTTPNVKGAPKFTAQNIKEVHMAIDHYFLEVNAELHYPENCPLCRGKAS